MLEWLRRRRFRIRVKTKESQAGLKLRETVQTFNRMRVSADNLKFASGATVTSDGAFLRCAITGPLPGAGEYYDLRLSLILPSGKIVVLQQGFQTPEVLTERLEYIMMGLII